MSLENQLHTLRDLLKTKIEFKFKTTTTSTDILNLIEELNSLIYSKFSNAHIITKPTIIQLTISEKIYTAAKYLETVLLEANVNCNMKNGFTTLIGKIDDIIIPKKNSTVSLNLNPSTITYEGSTTASASGYGTIKIGTTNGGSQIATGNGSASGTYTPPSAGNKTIYATSSGNSTYNGASNSKTLTVNKANSSTSIGLSSTSINIGDSVTITVYGTGTLKIGTSSGASDIGTLTSSGATLKYTPTTIGTKTIYITSTGDSNYNGASNSRTLTVNKISTKFTNASTSVSKGGSFTVYLKDTNNNTLSGQHVSITAKGTPQGSTTEYTKTYDVTSDTNGKLSVDLNLSWGNTTITFSCSYSGTDAKYKSCTGTYNITYTS